MKPIIPILLLASIIYGQFQTSDAKYRGFSKIDCLGLIIYGIDDDDLFVEIEKLTRSIAVETLPRNVKYIVNQGANGYLGFIEQLWGQPRLVGLRFTYKF